MDTVTALGPSSLDFTWLFLKMVFAMIFVIALAIVVLRYLLPRLPGRRMRGGGAEVSILERIPLDGKKYLVVLQVEGRRLLISVSENHAGLITELKSLPNEEEK